MKTFGAKNGTRKGSFSLVITQVVLAGYRKDFFKTLAGCRSIDANMHVLTGESDFSPTVVTDLDLGSNMTIVRNSYFLNRRVLFQHGVIWPCLKASVAVVILNPRIISAWIILLIRRIIGKRTILWGHAWPRSGKESPTDRVRGWMRGLADVVIVYTETEVEELAARMPNKTIIAARNALYSREIMRPLRGNHIPSSFIYVGRLVPEKKPELLLDAFAAVVERLPHTCKLVFVGDGPEKGSLMRKAARLNLSERVSFAGHVADPEQLRELYSQSIASVSPGYVGLSVTQSLGFGVPMIVADDEPHAPEIEAAREGQNARFFSAGSVESLGRELLRFCGEAENWYDMREAISKDCRDRYSCEAMASAFVAAIMDSEADTSVA